MFFFFFSSRRRHTRCYRDWSSDVCSSDLNKRVIGDFLVSEHRFEPVWRKAATFQQTNPRVTPDELMRIAEQIQELFEPYREREQPPEGAERIHASFVAVPWPLKPRAKRATTKKSTSRGKR